MNKKCAIALLLGSMLLLSACSQNTNSNESVQSAEIVKEESTAALSSDSNSEPLIQKDEGTEDNTMKITLNETEYEVFLDRNKTVDDILANMPFDLAMVKYAGHEYYAELPFTPVFDETCTSNIKAGHVYYWDGWNAFVINYVDYDISPYKVVHIGKIADASISEYLKSADENLNINVAN